MLYSFDEGRRFGTGTGASLNGPHPSALWGGKGDSKGCHRFTIELRLQWSSGRAQCGGSHEQEANAEKAKIAKLQLTVEQLRYPGHRIDITVYDETDDEGQARMLVIKQNEMVMRPGGESQKD